MAKSKHYNLQTNHRFCLQKFLLSLFLVLIVSLSASQTVLKTEEVHS